MGNYIHCKLTYFYLTVPFILAISRQKNKKKTVSRHKTLLDLQSHMIGIMMIRMTVNKNKTYLIFLIKHLSLVEDNASFPLITSFSEVLLNSEGVVSLVAPQESTSEAEFLSGLGEVVFNALDYGNGDDDDLELPDELENLLSYMIGTVDEDTTDDGFCENKITIRNVLKICKKHSGSEHKEHYKKVVKAGFAISCY